jgi:NTE family protein
MPFLRKVYLFSSFTESQLSLLAKKMTHVSFPKGALVFQENKPGDSLYIILSGSIRIIKKETNKKKEVIDKIVAYLSRGDVMGEMSLLTGTLHTKTALVDSSTELLVLHKQDFDNIIEKYPALAVHLSRLLSNRLAAYDRQPPAANSPGKIFAFLPALPVRDQVVFAVNFSTALVEQTRRKVLLLIVNEAPQLFAHSLGLEPTKVTNAQIKDGVFEEDKKFDTLVQTHPSGLEVIALDEKTFFDSLGTLIFPLFALIREHYDYAICILPARTTDISTWIFNEADRSAIVTGPQTTPADLEVVRSFYQVAQPSKKLEKIWLSVGPDFLPWDYTPDVRLPWDLNWGEQFMATNSPFIPATDRLAHRMIDRLARSYGSLLIGLAMGSGAAFGYSLIGILRILERENIYPDVISGTSMGALIGAFYAAGKSPDELEKIAQSITRKKLWQMVDLTFPRAGVIKGKGVLDFLRSHLGDKTFSDLQIPFCCVATDVQTGKEIDLDHGNVAEAVRASLSLPFFFEPYYLDGRYLVDGGLVNPVPTSIIVSQGANILLSANLTSRTGDRKIPRVMGWRKRLPHILRGPSLPEVLMKTIYTMQYEIARARSGIADVVMQINANDLLWWDLDRAAEIIKIGEMVAEENLPKIKALLPFFANSCETHLTRRGKKNY